jgi:hypothetical protein
MERRANRRGDAGSDSGIGVGATGVDSGIGGGAPGTQGQTPDDAWCAVTGGWEPQSRAHARSEGDDDGKSICFVASTQMCLRLRACVSIFIVLPSPSRLRAAAGRAVEYTGGEREERE